MPTAASSRYTSLKLEPYNDPTSARQINVNLGASLNLARGTVLGELTATPGTYIAYASGNADGSQVPKGILVYDVQTDASGNVTFSATSGQVGDQFGAQELAAPMYISGTFLTAELTGFDANALTKLAGHLESGTVAAGVVRIG